MAAKLTHRVLSFFAAVAFLCADGASAQEIEVLWKEDFEAGALPSGCDGAIVNDLTFGKSKGAVRYAYKTAEYYSSLITLRKTGPWPPPALFVVKPGATISFSIYGEKKCSLMVWMEAKPNKDSLYRIHFDITNPGEWKTYTFALDKFFNAKANNQPPPDGAEMNMFQILGGPDKADLPFTVDNIYVSIGGAPAEITTQISVQETEQRELVKSPAADGFLFSYETARNLRSGYKPGDVAQKSIMKVGTDAAASIFFIAPLGRDTGGLPTKNGYTYISDNFAVARAATSGEIGKKLAAALPKAKPEFVAVMFDLNDAAKTMTAAQSKANYDAIVKQILGAGAIPAIYTVPIQAATEKAAIALIAEYNKMIEDVAKSNLVPLVDAYGILNGPDSRKFFSGNRIAQAGYDQINNKTLELYKILDKYVIEKVRGSAPAAAPTAPAAPGANAPIGADGKPTP